MRGPTCPERAGSHVMQGFYLARMQGSKAALLTSALAVQNSAVGVAT